MKKTLLIVAACLMGGACLADEQEAAGAALTEAFVVRELQWGKSISREECQRLDRALWVETRLGTECIRYYPSPSLEAGGPKRAVVFFHGDRLAGSSPLGDYGKATPQGLLDTARQFEREHKVAYIFVARPGVYGSSGNHRERRRPKESASLNAALDGLKQRYGLEEWVLAGQSGGSTAAAAILTLGRSDVKCAALGSGNYAVNALAEIKRAKTGEASRKGCDVTQYCDAYDVIEHVEGIAPDAKRAIYIIGDPQDQNTVFELQRAFYEKVKQAGHAVRLMEIEGRGPERHSAIHVTNRVAGLCARGLPVESISGKRAE